VAWIQLAQYRSQEWALVKALVGWFIPVAPTWSTGRP
jgi:hypothetical protein